MGTQNGNNLWVGIGVSLKGLGLWVSGKRRKVLWVSLQLPSLSLASPILSQKIPDPLMKPSLPQAMCHYSIFSSLLSHCEDFPELCQPDCRKTCNSSSDFPFLLLSIHQTSVSSHISPAFIFEDWTRCYSWFGIWGSVTGSWRASTPPWVLSGVGGNNSQLLIQNINLEGRRGDDLFCLHWFWWLSWEGKATCQTAGGTQHL